MMLTRARQAGVSIAWTATELFIRCLTRNKPVKRYRGLHPGAHVGMHLGLVAAQAMSGSNMTPTRICTTVGVSSCISPETDIALAALAFILW
jgi:hypothetical protein